MTKCEVVGCEKTAAGGAHLFRTGVEPVRWVCRDHYPEAEISPRLRAIHEKWTPVLDQMGGKAPVREIPVEGGK